MAPGGNYQTVIERYGYTPYGEVTFLNPDFSVDGDQLSDIDNNYLYTGREHDPETGLYNYRTRPYHAGLGRFTTRDWIRYRGGMNLYGYVGGMPTGYVDPFGEHYPVNGPPFGPPPPPPEYEGPPGFIFDPVTGQPTHELDFDIRRDEFWYWPVPIPEKEKDREYWEEKERQRTDPYYLDKPIYPSGDEFLGIGLGWGVGKAALQGGLKGVGRFLADEAAEEAFGVPMMPLPRKGFRCISKAELDDIKDYGFRPHPKGKSMQDKWFSESQEGAE